MNLKFEVENKVLHYKKPYNNIHTDSDGLFSSFVFTTPDWKHIDKYAIFWDKKGKSYIRYLGKGMKLRCPTPHEILNDLYFNVQVYANDEIKTQKKKVFIYDEVCLEENEKNEKQELEEFLTRINNKIDNIIYEDNKFLIYANNKLIKTINVVDANLLEKVLRGIAPDYIIDTTLSEDSGHAVANKVLYRELQKKANITDLAPIAITGDYNDLENKPEAFPPEAHTHVSVDITDWEDSVDKDIEDFIDDLIQHL